ncbi:hypothetical protein 1992IndM4_0370 [Vibrio phage ICP1]|nr:hypothetical protein 1992IndM4_0370 [Vibrio phage ICP1]
MIVGASSNLLGIVISCQIETIRSEVSILKDFPLDGDYKVTEDGKVFSIKRGTLKELKFFKDISGNYYRVKLNKQHWLVHRVVALTFIPNPNNLPQVNHIDGDKTNNHYTNLEWTTSSGNQLHAYDIGLKMKPRGVDNGNVKLSEKEVLSLYEKLLSGVCGDKLAIEYGITSTQISRIKGKKLWKHILCDLPDIELHKRAPLLTENQKRDIESCIMKGLTCKQSFNFLKFSFTTDQFYRIKRYLQRSEIIESTHSSGSE